MKWLRLRISTLVLLVIFCSVAFAAARHANDDIDMAVFSATAVALVWAGLRAWQRTDRLRAFWGGFAVAGGLYLLASCVPPLESRLITTRGLLWAQQQLEPRSEIVTMAGADGAITHAIVYLKANEPYRQAEQFFQEAGAAGIRTFSIQRAASRWPAEPEALRRVGHSLAAWIVAASGGLAAVAEHRRRTRARPIVEGKIA